MNCSNCVVCPRQTSSIPSIIQYRTHYCMCWMKIGWNKTQINFRLSIPRFFLQTRRHILTEQTDQFASKLCDLIRFYPKKKASYKSTGWNKFHLLGTNPAHTDRVDLSARQNFLNKILHKFEPSRKCWQKFPNLFFKYLFKYKSVNSQFIFSHSFHSTTRNSMPSLDEKFQAAVDIVQKLPKEGMNEWKIANI